MWLLRKEVIHPHLSESQQIYDLILVAGVTFCPYNGHSGAPNFTNLTGGVYKTWERIHRGMLIRDYYQFHVHEGELQPSIPT